MVEEEEGEGEGEGRGAERRKGVKGDEQAGAGVGVRRGGGDGATGVRSREGRSRSGRPLWAHLAVIRGEVEARIPREQLSDHVLGRHRE